MCEELRLSLTLHMYDTYGTRSLRVRPERASSELVPCHGLPEPDTLVLGDIELERARLAAPIRARDRTRTPRRSTVNFGQVGELAKRAAVPERDEDDTVVRERGDRVADGRFLTTAGRTRGDEHARKLARQGAFAPEFTRGVPKGLPLCREVTVTSWDTEDVGVELRQLVDGNDRVLWFSRGVQFGEDFR